MSDELNQMESTRDDVPPQQSSSPAKKGSAPFAWIVLIFVFALIATYFYYNFVLLRASTSEMRSVDSSQIQEQENSSSEVLPQIDKILEVRFEEGYGDYYIATNPRVAVYVDTLNYCEPNCGLSWKPYSGEVEINEGKLSSMLNEITGQYEYKWEGKQMYLFIGDVNPAHLRGLDNETGFSLITQ